MHFPSVCALVILLALNVKATLYLVVAVFERYPTYEFPIREVQVNRQTGTGTFEIINLSFDFKNMLEKIPAKELVHIGAGNALKNNPGEMEVVIYLKFEVVSSLIASIQNGDSELTSKYTLRFTFNLTKENIRDDNLGGDCEIRGAFLTTDKQDIIDICSNNKNTDAPGNIILLQRNTAPQLCTPNGLIVKFKLEDIPEVQTFRIYKLPSTMASSPLLSNRIDFIKSSEIDKVQEVRLKTRKFFNALGVGQQNGNQAFTHEGILIDDYFFLRFLRGKRGNIKKASELVKECVKFKTTDDAYKSFLGKQTAMASCLHTIPILRYETSEKVRKIFFIDLSEFKLAEALKQISADDILTFVYTYVKDFEDILEKLRRSEGGSASKITLVVNLKNFKFNLADVLTCGIQGQKVISGVITAFAKYSPEMFEEIFLVDFAESSIPGIKLLAKSCSNKSTRNITYVRNWTTYLHQTVGVNDLPMDSAKESANWKRYTKP